MVKCLRYCKQRMIITMQFLSNCHTHTQFCDGRSTAEAMVERALELGFVSLGFSSHGPQKFDTPYSISPDQEESYKAEINRLKEKYKGQIRIYLGIERDLFSIADPQSYEYYLASVHYIPTCRGTYVGVDGNPELISRYIREDLGGNGLLFAQKYYELLTGYARAYKPPIIGHFDLLRKNNLRLQFVDESASAYRDIALQSLQALYETGAMLEVNTGAIARGYFQGQYPDEYALKYWAKLGGEVMVNSDCHDAKDLDCAFDKMPQLLSRCGFDHVVRLGAGDSLFERIAL